MVDKNGKEIKAGNWLFNPHDRDKYHEVIEDENGNLFLGDYDSPLENYSPWIWWELSSSSQPVQ